MEAPHEDEIYEWQQTLAALPRDQWKACLEAHNVAPMIVAEVMDRLARLSESLPAGSAQTLRCDAPDAGSDLDMTAWLEAVGYEQISEVGRGGMGVVYRVRERKRGDVVALKTLLAPDPRNLLRFKQEFRALADVSHPNLAVLYDVVSDGARWCFTMEFVDGVDFLTYVRAGRPAGASLDRAGIDRLEATLDQLAAGLSALHQAGKLHRDIKPSNLLVTPAGRAVLVDFGLAMDLGGGSANPVTQGQVAGTVEYMSPEHVLGEPLTTASDWYSVGVMVFEALTGRLPAHGSLAQMVRAKVDGDGPAPRSVADEVPSGLDALCERLLRREPAHRGAVDRAQHAAASASRLAPPRPAASVLVGRTVPLAALAEAREQVKPGRPVLVLLAGASGVGKTALLQQFLASSTAASAETVVLAGRCYEQESVPYKALDGAVDALARYLARLPQLEAEALLPRDVGPLVRVFPVFRMSRAVAAVRASEDDRDPHDLRRAAFAGLRELLGRLGDRRLIVLAIDDAQWGDSDSSALLLELLQPPRAPGLLVVACYRHDEEAGSPFLRVLNPSASRLADLDVRRVSIGPLTHADVRELVSRLTNGAAQTDDADLVVRESGGNPLFVQELVRHLADSADAAGQQAASDLTSVIQARVRQLSEHQQRLLEVLAVARQPLAEAVACEVAGLEGSHRAAISELRAARLARIVSRPELAAIETYHDRIREAVYGTLPEATRVAHHGRLAAVLERVGLAEAETVAGHYAEAGDASRAAHYYVVAADRAASALAFDRAARFYGLALELAPAKARNAAVLTRLADVLTAAGRGTEAGRTYLTAAELSEPGERAELLRRGAEQLLSSGNLEPGLAALRALLDFVRMRLPATAGGALASLLLRRLWLRLRGLRYRVRAGTELSAATLTRIDSCWSVTIGLGMVDVMRGAAFQSRYVLLALDAGEPLRIARALSLEAVLQGLAGTRAARRTRALLDQARQLAVTMDDPYPAAFVTLSEGITAWMTAQWRSCHERSAEAERRFVVECRAPSWETSTAQVFQMAALLWMGDLVEHRRRMPALLRQARERGNLYAEVNIQLLGYSHLTALADDDADRAVRTLDELVGRWSSDRFDLQQFWAAYGRAETLLYTGDGTSAHELVLSTSGAVRRSLLLRGQTMRIAWTALVGRAALAGLIAGDNRLERDVLRAAARLSREQTLWADAGAAGLRAAVAALRGRTGDAIVLLRRAEEIYRAIDMRLFEASSVWARSVLESTPASLDSARSALAAQDVRQPPRLVRTLLPGPWTA